jgi:predicted RNA-binding Zn-ribbon protein involved in translation (DUF1610 family)
MSGLPVTLFVILGLGAVFLLAGVWLVWRGSRGRRVGDTPHCAKCGYSLVAQSSDRCPECGADVTVAKGVVRGERVRGRRALAAGACATLVAAGLFAVAATPVRNVDWYTLMPTGFVLDDLKPGSRSRGRAWTELMRRESKDGTLPQPQRDRLIAAALDEQEMLLAGGGPLSVAMIDWLGREALAGRLDATQKERFFARCVRPYLRVRQVVVAGDEAAYRVDPSFRGPTNGPPTWWLSVDEVSKTVDHGAAQPGTSTAFADGLGSGGQIDSTVSVDGLGPHTLNIVCRVRVWTGPARADFRSKLNTCHFDREVTMSGDVLVVADGPERTVERIEPNPEGEAQLRAAITVEGFTIETGEPRMMRVGFRMGTFPFDVAFAAIARVNGKEYPLSSFARTADENISYHVGGRYDGPADIKRIDVILRPDRKAAARRVDVFRMWGGEIEFKDVGLRPRPY